MKKEFIKKLSFAMASALVLTGAAPAVNVEAAATMKMTKSSKVLYLNDDNMTGTSNTVDLGIKNKPTNYKTKYSFNWYAEDTSIVKVAKGGVVTAKKVGQTTVKCDITKKSNKKLVTTATCVVTVKANAATIAISNAPEGNKMAVGSTFDFNRTMKDANGKKATDKTEWVVSDPEVASVDKNGVVTALKAGTFTLKACAYQSAATKDKGYTAESEEITITVAPSITKLTQTTTDQFEVEFDSDMSKLTASDFNVTNASGVKQIVKTVKFDATGKKATVTLYLKMADKVDYTVKAGDVDAQTFTASVGEAATVTVQTTKVSDNVSNESIKVKICDANGIQLYYGDGNTNLVPGLNAGDSIAFSTTDSSKGYFDGNKLIAYKIGDVVPVTVTYYTGKINTTTGEPEKIVSEATGVTVVDDASATITSVVATTITDGVLGKKADWSNVKNTVSVTDVPNSGYASNKYLHVKAVDSSNTTVYSNAYYADDKKDGWTFQSADTTVLNIDEVTGELMPVSAGTANVICKYGDFSYVATVTVGAARTAASVAVNQSSATLSNAVTNSQTFELKIKDNYGDDMVLSNATVEAVSKPTIKADKSALALVLDPAFKSGDKVAKFTATYTAGGTVQDGTYTFKLTATDKLNSASRSYTVTVVVANAGTKVSYYKVVAGTTNKDITINHWNVPANNEAENFDIKVAGVNNAGIQVEDASTIVTELKVTDPNGKVITTDTDNIKFNSNVITVKPYVVSGTSITKMQAGQYRVEAKVNDNGTTKAASATVFTIVDNQKQASVDLKKNEVKVALGENLVSKLIADEIIKSEEGTVVGVSELNISSAAEYKDGAITKAGTYTVTLRKIKVAYEIRDNKDDVVATTVQDFKSTYSIKVTAE